MPSRLYPWSRIRKCCSLRATLSPFTATSPGHTHGRSKKAQLSLAFSEWKENTGAAGRVGRKLSSCQSASAAIQRNRRPPLHTPHPSPPPKRLLAFVTRCHCLVWGSAVGHTARHPVEKLKHPPHPQPLPSRTEIGDLLVTFAQAAHPLC